MEKLKTCTFCNKCWTDIHTLLEDTDLVFEGYMPNPLEPAEGMFLFSHDTKKCGTTFALKVKSFITLLPDEEIELPPFTLGQQPDCKGHCLSEKNLSACTSKNCRGRVIRDLMIKIKSRLTR